MIPVDHKLLTSSVVGPKDLAVYLRDGVVLCHLLNKIEPGIIENKDFSQHPQLSQFLCMWNSKVFIQKCKSEFGLSDADLYDPSDLYHLLNFDKVLRTLSALSTSEKAGENNIKPLVLNRNSSYDLRGEVEDTTGQDTDNYITEDENTYQNVDSKSIYDDLCSIRTSLQMKENNAAPKSKRDLCIQELVMTEKKYVEALKMIKLCFMKPLQSILSVGDHKTIFHGIEKLWQTHVDFEMGLRSAVKDTEMLIPDCFIANKEKFLFYGEFCSNLTTGQELLDKLIETNPVIKVKVRECELYSVNGGKFKLRDLLALPMQRILKYHLFLKEMIKHTEDNQLEKLMLERALDEIQDLSLFINEVKRDNDTISAMQLVQSSILDMPMSLTLKDCGRFIMDAELKLKSEPEHSVNTRQLFLFDMIILVCKSKGDNTFNYKGVISLKDFSLEDVLIKEKNMFGFQLTNKTNRKCYHVIFTKKEDIRTKWLEAVTLAMENIEPPHAINELHEFHMWSFGKPTICDVCRKLLRGVFYQGYRCSKTKMAVHKNCLEGAKDMTGPPTCILPPRSMKAGHSGTLTPRSPRSPNYPMAKVKAIESYSGSPPPMGDMTPLKFEVNDVIRVLPTSLDFSGEDGWFEGELNGLRGFFPKKSVRSLFQQQRSTSYEPHVLQRSASSIIPSTMSPRILPVGGRTSQPISSASAMTRVNSETDLDQLSNKDWFAGEMSRDDATAKLFATPEGTFLIRQSVDEARKGELALSIKINDTVKHIRIGRSLSGECYLSNSKVFRTITDLVEHYQTNSLESLFPEVRSTLLNPLYSIIVRQGTHQVCVAVFDYNSPSSNHLSFNRGDKIEIIHKVGDSLGWWKGRIGSKVGYFPVTYVKLT